MAENDPQTSADLDLVLKDLAQRIERLKQLYEQYFMGIERIEPTVARKEVTRAMLGLQQNYIRNTALRFRFNTMLQKWSLYTTYWNRTLREIENGTYVRHLQKAARHAEQRGRALPSEMLRNLGPAGEAPAVAEPALDGGGDDDLDALLDAALGAVDRPTPKPATPTPPAPPPPAAPAVAPPRPGPPPLPPGARGAVPSPLPGTPTRTPTPPGGVPVSGSPTPPGGVTIRVTPPGGVPIHRTPPTGVPARAATPAGGTPTLPGVSEGELRALHRKYSEARAKAGDAAPVRYEALVASLAKQVPKMMEQPGVKGVRFDVAIRDGKPVVKAIPTK